MKAVRWSARRYAEIEGFARSASNRIATGLRVSVSHRLFLPALTVLAVALFLPSVSARLSPEDYVLLAILSGSSTLSHLYPSRLDIFNFFDGNPERMRQMLDLGLLPWWTFPGTRLAFWRPVSTMTHWLDYAAWRDLPVLMHLQSLLWFSGLVVAVGLMYRRLMGSAGAAGAATLLYALDRTHILAVTWLAGRNAILGAFFGTLTLVFHDRWRRAGWRAGSLVAPACLALALLSAEKAVAIGAYLVAHAVFLDRGSWRRRLWALLPHGIVVAVWLLVYTGLGYGVLGAAPGYLNPMREPLQFAGAVAKNGPILLLAQWTGPPAEGFSQLSHGAADARWVGALVTLAVLAALLAPLLKRDPVARFWGLGQVLAVVPVCAVAPQGFYLNFVALGAMGLMAQFLCSVLARESWRPARTLWWWPAALLVGVLVAVHLIASPLELVRSATTTGYSGVEEASDSISTDEAVRRQLVVIVNVPSAVVVSYSFFIRTVKGQPIPAQTRLLASGGAPLSLFRADARTLRVRWEGPQQRIFRTDQNPMTARERVRLTRTDIEVTAVTEDGWPAEAMFHFDTDLEDPTLRWLRWTSQDGHGRFVSFRPPSVGETVHVR